MCWSYAVFCTNFARSIPLEDDLPIASEAEAGVASKLAMSFATESVWRSQHLKRCLHSPKKSREKFFVLPETFWEL